MADNDKDPVVQSADAIGILPNYEKSVKRAVVHTSAPKKPVFLNASNKNESSQIDREAECYNMNHPKRGTAVLFNHHIFDGNESARNGTEKDGGDFMKVLQDLKFDVTICKDFKYTEILDKLNSLARADHSNSDCLVVSVLTHGGEGQVRARDHAYAVEKLWKPFAGNKCTTLAGKPKMFFIQACRGEELDNGVRIQHDASNESNSYRIPAMADILVMYSTYEGHYSFRSPSKGSWFIQSLCAALKEHAKTRDLLTILTFVNRRIAIDFQSISANEELNGKKQIGTVVSTLTRLVYFYNNGK